MLEEGFKMSKIIIYKDTDYVGQFNLLRNERRLVLRAFLRANGDLKVMANLLETTEKSVLLKMVCHNLSKDLIDIPKKELSDLPLFTS